MGFKTVSRQNNEDSFSDGIGYYSRQNNEELYIVNGIGYFSRHEFTTIESINRNLKIMRPGSFTREDEGEFDCILDRVEERIERLNQKIRAVEIDGFFEDEFPFIIDFLVGTNSLPDNTNNHFEKRFIYLPKRMKEKGF